MKLEALIEIASNGYPDGMIGRCFRNKKANGDTLALFLAKEIEDTFDKTASDADQLTEALRILDAAIREIQSVRKGVVKALESIPSKS